MYYGALKKTDIANGPGVRVSLFVSGCRHHCKECFNPETWNFDYGQEFTQATIAEILQALQPDYIKGITILGGEPFEPENQRGLLELYRRLRAVCPKKSVWVYTGYTLESDLLSEGTVRTEVTDEILSVIDVLVDGEFVLERKNITLKFRGSENQRIINLRESLAQGQTVLIPDDEIS
jgi:anaerobic ribonucleoside-triphosphate reductase activating protein